MPLSLRDVTVLWIHEGLKPSSGAFKNGWPYPLPVLQHRQPFGTNIVKAVEHVRDHRVVYKQDRLMPWLHAGTGDGSAVLNWQGILALGLALGIVF